LGKNPLGLCGFGYVDRRTVVGLAGTLESRGCAIQRLCQHDQLLRGAGGVCCFHGLIDSGQHNGGIAGVLAGSVDGVAIPGAVGQAGIDEQGGLCLAKAIIELIEVASGRELASVDPVCRRREALHCPIDRIKVQ